MSRLAAEAAEAAEAEEVIITVRGGEGGGGVEINLHHKISFIGGGEEEGEDSFDRDNNNREGEREDESMNMSSCTELNSTFGSIAEEDESYLAGKLNLV